MAITFQAEKFAEVFSEAQPMLKRHFQEIALHQDKIPFGPDIPRYLAAEAAGNLLIVTARDGDELKGYASVIIGKRLHNVTVASALIESIWLAPECRGKRLGSGLFDAVERLAAERGAAIALCNSKIAHPALAFLLDKRGYERIEVVHSKFLAPSETNTGEY